MVYLVILRDNREQKPWEFEDFDTTVNDTTLSTGDYTIPQLCKFDQENSTYHPRFAVERKGGNDFISSITADRDRFRREVKRAENWEKPMPVVVEEKKTTFKRKLGFMRHRDVSPSQIFGTVDKWETYYNVEFHFTGTRERAQRKAVEELEDALVRELV